MQSYNLWSWEEKKKLIIKIVEWAQRNNKNIYGLTKDDLFEAIKYK